MTETTSKPYRNRAEMYALSPEGRILGGLYDEDRTFGVFGGGVDDGEDIPAAAAREMFEESGYNVLNPRIVPVEPMSVEWGAPKPDDSPERAARKAKYRGSQTHFITGDLGEGDIANATDPSNLQRIRLRSLAAALRLLSEKRLQKAQHPELAAKRKAVLQYLAQQQRIKQSAFGTEKKIDTSEQLKRLGSQLGALVPNLLLGGAVSLKSNQPMLKSDKDVLIALLKNHANIDVKPGGFAGLHYQPRNKTVYTPGIFDVGRAEAATNTPVGTLAHEFGHARQAIHNKYPLVGRIGRGMGVAGMLGGHVGTALAKDEQTSLAIGGVGTALGIPLVADELQASWKGSKELAKAFREAGKKIPLHRRLTPFIGVPSYAAAVSIPLLQHFLNKRTGVFKKKKD